MEGKKVPGYCKTVKKKCRNQNQVMKSAMKEGEETKCDGG